MSVSVPAAAIDVASKENMPSIASNSERRGFSVHGRIMFKVMSHWSVMRHQLAMRKDGGAPALMEVKWFFHVRMHRSAMLVR